MAEKPKPVDTAPIFDLSREAVLAARALREAIHGMVPFVTEDVRLAIEHGDPELAAIIRDGKESVPNDPVTALAMMDRIDQMGRDRAHKAKAEVGAGFDPETDDPRIAALRAEQARQAEAARLKAEQDAADEAAKKAAADEEARLSAERSAAELKAADDKAKADAAAAANAPPAP
jgi:hypothetical protein